MYLFINLFIIIVINIILINAQTTFNYTDQYPNYIVGIDIGTNTPSISLQGTYELSPHFSKGLVFNPTNGQITGTPIEEYVGTYVIRFTEDNTGSIYTSTILITSIFIFIIIVWDKPTKLDYGIQKLRSTSPLSLKLSPIVDNRVTEYTLSFSPEIPVTTPPPITTTPDTTTTTTPYDTTTTTTPYDTTTSALFAFTTSPDPTPIANLYNFSTETGVIEFIQFNPPDGIYKYNILNL